MILLSVANGYSLFLVYSCLLSGSLFVFVLVLSSTRSAEDVFKSISGMFDEMSHVQWVSRDLPHLSGAIEWGIKNSIFRSTSPPPHLPAVEDPPIWRHQSFPGETRGGGDDNFNCPLFLFQLLFRSFLIAFSFFFKSFSFFFYSHLILLIKRQDGIGTKNILLADEMVFSILELK